MVLTYGKQKITLFEYAKNRAGRIARKKVRSVPYHDITQDFLDLLTHEQQAQVKNSFTSYFERQLDEAQHKLRKGV